MCKALVKKNSRVDQGSYLPRPPADPDVRHSRIRLLRSRFRYLTVHGLDDDRCRHRITRQKPVERIPPQPSALRSTRQPVVPGPKQVMAEKPEPLPVSGDPVVRTVTPEFPHKFCVLPSDRFVAVVPAPEVDGLQCPAEAVPCCPALNCPDPTTGQAPEVGEPQKIERPRARPFPSVFPTLGAVGSRSVGSCRGADSARNVLHASVKSPAPAGHPAPR